MWMGYVPKTFYSIVNPAEEQDCSGKWLVPIAFDAPQSLWFGLEEAAHAGIFVAVKRSAPELDSILGHCLVCVYCTDSREETVRTALGQLREIGVTGDIEYKTDKATYQDRDDKLYSSSLLESAPTP